MSMPTTRRGRTHKMQVGVVTLYITVNRDDSGNVREVFCKADEGHQAEADGLAELSSLLLQHDCPPEKLVRHLRFRRYEPHGFAGQPCSISDAIGRAIEEEVRNV